MLFPLSTGGNTTHAYSSRLIAPSRTSPTTNQPGGAMFRALGSRPGFSNKFDCAEYLFSRPRHQASVGRQMGCQAARLIMRGWSDPSSASRPCSRHAGKGFVARLAKSHLLHIPICPSSFVMLLSRMHPHSEQTGSPLLASIITIQRRVKVVARSHRRPAGHA